MRGATFAAPTLFFPIWLSGSNFTQLEIRDGTQKQNRRGFHGICRRLFRAQNTVIPTSLQWVQKGRLTCVYCHWFQLPSESSAKPLIQTTAPDNRSPQELRDIRWTRCAIWRIVVTSGVVTAADLASIGCTVDRIFSTMRPNIPEGLLIYACSSICASQH